MEDTRGYLKWLLLASNYSFQSNIFFKNNSAVVIKKSIFKMSGRVNKKTGYGFQIRVRHFRPDPDTYKTKTIVYGSNPVSPTRILVRRRIIV